MSTTRYVDVDRTLKTLRESELHPENIEAIEAFVNHCAAEDLSEVRQERLISALKMLLKKFAPEGFRLMGATEDELKEIVAGLNRSEYKDSSKHTFRSALKKFYKFENGGGKHPDKVQFFSVSSGGKATTVTREDLFTKDELKRLLRGFSSTRDRAMTLVLYEAAARPGEMLALNIADFTSNGKGDFVFLEGLKDTTDRTNQLIRAGRTVREWLTQHPLGGELGDISDTSVPLWVKTEQQACKHCESIPHNHDDQCDYEPDLADRLPYAGYYRRFKKACEKANIPENKRRPYNLRHTRLTEVANFMGYEQLNKFAGWKPGSDRAKVYVHLNNDDVNRAIREEYGLDSGEQEQKSIDCPFCGATNQSGHSECRTCGRPVSLKQKVEEESQLSVLELLDVLEKKGVIDKGDVHENIGSPT